MISVIVTTFNNEMYIDECLDSIINQSFQDFEIIIVDDGSTDNTLKKLAKYKTNTNIFIISKLNGGVSSARNQGLSNARGEFICFIDGDDYISPDYFEILIKAYNERRADIIITGIDLFIKRHGKELFFESHPGVDNYCKTNSDIFEFVYPAINTFTVNPPVCKLYRTSIIRENQLVFDQNLSIGEDLVFNLNYLRFCTSATFVAGSYYHYRRDSNLLTKQYSGDFEQSKKRMVVESYNILKNYGYTKSFYYEQLIHATFSYFLELPSRLTKVRYKGKLSLIMDVSTSADIVRAASSVHTNWSTQNKVFSKIVLLRSPVLILSFSRFINSVRSIKSRYKLLILDRRS